MEVMTVTKKTLNKFIDFPQILYRDDPFFVPYFKKDLKKKLKNLLFETKKYTALIVTDGNKNVLGRVLFTIAKNKQLKTELCGFFSMYECVEDINVSNLLLSEMKRILTKQGAEYISGSFFPDDPDNRRGILCEGFENNPTLFTSYNFAYYNDFLKAFGFEKQIDAVSLVLDDLESADIRLAALADYMNRSQKFHLDCINVKNPEQDIQDIHYIMEQASTEINYQEVPSLDELRQIFIDNIKIAVPEYVMIARRNEDNAPIGFMTSLPDYYQVFRKMKGRSDIFAKLIFLKNRKKIDAVRAILQYVIPEYQKRGVAIRLYESCIKSGIKNNVKYVEMGTIMENNTASVKSIMSFGAKPYHRYRIYFMKLD